MAQQKQAHPGRLRPHQGETSDAGNAELLTVREVARILRTHPDSVRPLLASGEIAGAWKWLGRYWRIPRASLDDYLRRMAAGA
jgi:excisionase family DNA binding protein